MNLVIIVLDSLRQDHVSIYHGGKAVFPDIPACQTPHLDAFAGEAVVFENAYPEGLPTMPARYALLTGQETLPFRAWQPLAADDLSAAEILGREGYVCGIISDNYHYRAPGMNYHRGFHAYHWIRGQEYDPYNSAPPRRNVEDFVNSHYSEVWRRRVSQCLANFDDIESEEDWFAARVFRQAIAWLEQNRQHKKLFLFVDCFDPHEPWFPPPSFDTYGDPSYRGPKLVMPMGGLASDWATPEEQRCLRSLYAGEVAYVDYWLGRFFAAMARLGYSDDTLTIITADHGHPLGDHGKFLKGTDRLYNELLKVPFLWRFPGGRYGGWRTSAIIQFQDVLPTALDVLGLGGNWGCLQGRSFRPVLEGIANSHRPAAIVGYHEGPERCLRDDRWSLILRPEGEADELYDLQSDPREQRNLIDVFPQEAARLSSQFGSVYFRGARRSEVKGIQGRYELSSARLD